MVRTVLRVLFFRATREELLALDGRHLALGLFSTWVVGMGRYWDSPRAEFLQKLGVGSVLYVFALALFLWLVLWPLRPKDGSFLRLLTFITLVSPPAALYAIPVERFVSLQAAKSLNAWFLAVVAAWRVALLFFFLVRLYQLRWFAVVVASLLPLSLIVTGLWILNLEHVVFELMSGIRPEQRSSADGAYLVLTALSFASATAFPFLLLGYVALVAIGFVRRRKVRTSGQAAQAAAAGPANPTPATDVVPPELLAGPSPQAHKSGAPPA